MATKIIYKRYTGSVSSNESSEEKRLKVLSAGPMFESQIIDEQDINLSVVVCLFLFF